MNIELSQPQEGTKYQEGQCFNTQKSANRIYWELKQKREMYSDTFIIVTIFCIWYWIISIIII